jgi:hypothetical protein
MEQRFIRVLPFYLRPVTGDPETELPMPVALWRSASNICESREPGSRCDDSQGLYYSIAGDHVVWQCTRHWYEACLGPNAPYRLIDMTDEQFRREQTDQRARFQRDWATVSERLRSSAALLQSAGLQEQAGRIWEAHGSIESSLRRL